MIFTLLLSFMGIDHLAHIGGFAGGALMALLVPSGEQRGRGETVWQLLALAGVLLVLFAFYKVSVFSRFLSGA